MLQKTLSLSAGDCVSAIITDLVTKEHVAREECGDVVVVRESGQVVKADLSSPLSAYNIGRHDHVVILRPLGKPAPVRANEDSLSREQIARFLKAHAHERLVDAPSHTGSTSIASTELTYTTILQALNILWHWSTTLQQALASDAAVAAAGEQEEAEEEEADTSYSELVDQGALQSLMAMGFPQARCVKALVLTHMDPTLAMDWLLLHEDDPTIDDPLSPPPKQPRSQSKAGGADPLLFQRLKDMGFPAADADAALQLAHNNFEEACDMLVRGVDVHSELQQHKAKIGEIDSPLAREILKEPSVHAALCSPAVRNAIGEMIRDTNSISAFLYDPAVGPMLHKLVTILREMPPTEGEGEEEMEA